ncbi:MAG TPA: lipase [Marmoricola sp.]|jgi:hypothetical protein|nr:lipase [Marmoricola sp.]
MKAPVLLIAIMGLLAASVPTSSADSPPGPSLTVTAAQLDTALTCSGPLTGLTHDPVLLTPAFSTGPESYGFNYERQLPAIGITTCTLTLPDDGYGDLQHDAEYDVLAIRRMHAESGRQIVLLGHQHGGLDGLWALRFWPDLATDVSDFISLATPYNGTRYAANLCHNLGRCPASYWQIATGSRFLAALAGPLPAGPAYTSIASQYDELIVPEPFASHLDGASDVILQDLCPGRPIEHFTILADNETYELVLDAMSHAGPAELSRIPKSVCTGPLYLPGVIGPSGAVGLVQGFGGFLVGLIQHVPASVSAEPALMPYAR